MDYVLIIIFQALGVFFKAGQQIAILKNKYPGLTGKQTVDTYWKEDWNTLIMSGGVLGFNLAVHYVVAMLDIDWSQKFELFGISTTWSSIYLLFSVGIAITLGYKGQDLIYKWLGTAAEKLDKEVSSKLNG